MERAKAIAHVKDMYEHMLFREDKEALETLIPELRESEEEKIRKWIYNLVSNMDPQDDDAEKELDEMKPLALAWLEKQKDLDKMIVVSPEVWDKAINDAFENGKKEQKEQNPAQSREEILHQLFQNGSISLSDYLYLTGEQKPKQEWSEEDELMRTTVIQTLKTFTGRGTTGMQIDWLKSLPERFNPQPKQEWSEEDSKRYVSIGTTLETSAVLSKEDYDANMVWLRDLVNAIKYSGPKPSWKPSEEQMTALFEAMQETRPGWLFNRQLVSLYDDLKKL